MMKRFKFLALAAALALPIAACDEGSQSTVIIEGSVVGTVTVEGNGVSGVTVTLSSGASASTDASGGYSFTGVPAGSYTVSISGGPSDATFPTTSKGVVIQSAGQTVQANFDGQYIRTSSIGGTVSAGGAGIPVTVSLSGVENKTFNSTNGVYSFTGLRAGSYTVQISGFDAQKYTFSPTSKSVSVSSGASESVNFEGSENATGTITASVTIDGAAANGVVLTLSNGDTEVTNTAGNATFSGLAKGTYAVTLTNPDDVNLSFDGLTKNATIADIGGSASVEFAGETIAKASIIGRVYNEENGTPGYQPGGDTPWVDQTVELSNGLESITDEDGLYAFRNLASGDYTVSFENPDPDNLIFTDTDVDVEIENPNQAYTVDFVSIYRADNSVSGRVWLDLAADGEYTSADEPAAGFDITAENAALGLSFEETTDADGKYMFDGLRSGTWTITCVTCPADFGGREWSWTAPTDVELGEGVNATANFIGTVTGYTNDMNGSLVVQTADASESKALALAGVDITIVGPFIPGAGDPPTATVTTDANGEFSAEGLAPGNYNVTIDVTDLPANLTLVGPATVTVNVADDLNATATVPAFTVTIATYTIRVPVHYGPEGSTAWDNGDRVALYQSEQLDALPGNLLDVQITASGYAVYDVAAADVSDDYVLFTCLPSAVAACTDGVIQMGAAILADPVIEHRIDGLEYDQMLPEDHNLVFRSFSLDGIFRQKEGEPVPNSVVLNPRVDLFSTLGWNTEDDATTATFGSIANDRPGDGLDQNGAAAPDEDEGEFTYTGVNAIADLGLTVNDIASGIWIYITGDDCYINACGVGGSDHLLDYTGNDGIYEVWYFDGSSMQAVMQDNGEVQVTYPNPDVRFHAWHETNDIRGFQSGVGGDDALELTDVQLHIGWDRDDDGTYNYSPIGDCFQPQPVTDPTLIRCTTDGTGLLGDVDMIDQERITLLALSNDAPNPGPPLSPISELQFIDASITYQDMVDIDSGDPLHPAPAVFDGESSSEIDITSLINDCYFVFDLQNDGHAWKFKGNTGRGLVWDEIGAMLDDNGIRDDDAGERAVGGIIFSIDAEAGQLGFEDFTPFEVTTTPNVNSFPPNGNAGVARFNNLLEGTYVISGAGVDDTQFMGGLVIVERAPITGEISFVPFEDFSDEIDVQATVADVKASPANTYEAQYTNGMFSGYVFENEDDNSVIDPSEGINGEGVPVLIERRDDNTGLFAEYMTVTAGTEGFWMLEDVQEGEYRISLEGNAGLNLEGSNPASRVYLDADANAIVDTGRFGQTRTHDGGGVNLLGMPGNSGDAFDGNWAAIPDITETDLEMVHNNGAIRVRLEDDVSGALLGAIVVELRMCSIDPANLEDDVNAPGGGFCASVPVDADVTATSTTAGPVTFPNLVEGFYEISIAGAAPVTGTNTWYVRIDREGEIAERTTTY